MNYDDEFIRAIVTNPGDLDTRQEYIRALEKKNDKRAYLAAELQWATSPSPEGEYTVSQLAFMAVTEKPISCAMTAGWSSYSMSQPAMNSTAALIGLSHQSNS